jgi:hypothetical protein
MSRSPGIKLDLRSPGDVAAGYQELAGRFGDDLERVLLQPMLTGGVETLVSVGRSRSSARRWCSASAVWPPTYWETMSRGCRR